MNAVPGVERAAIDAALRAEGHWQQGLALSERGCWREAARAHGRAARAAPHDALYWINLGHALRQAGLPARALAAARRALQKSPGDPIALRLQGSCLMQLHRYAQAAQAFAELEAAGHEEFDALLQHASVLQSLLRHGEAADVLLRALMLKPGEAQAYALLSDALRDQGMKREAAECMKTVLALQPGNLQALSRLSYEKRHLLDWQGLDADVERITQLLHAAPPDEARIHATFALLSLPLEPEVQRLAAASESRAMARGVHPLPAVAPASRAGRRVRVGWVSYDFRDHPVSQLLVEVLERFDREAFEIVLYSSGPDDRSALRGRIAAAADRFVDLRGLSDAQAAARIRADGIDLLVDLMGHTRGARLSIFAHRAAPVQVSYLGYPGSTGADYIDYFVGDPIVTPPAVAPHFSEKLAQLPLCFQPNGRSRPLPRPMTRAAAGLPEGAFVMCAFNHTYKILPQAFDTWCAVLRDVPQAVLWLKETNPQMRGSMLDAAAARGVAAERVVFAQTVSYAEHFSRLALADVFVDTWPYNAHTTAADALWAGVPVVTVYGNAFASRVAASVLSAAGIGELAFGSADEYRCAITALALEPELRAGYQRHLREQRLSLPLFDTARYAGELQSLFGRMVERWRAGLAPDHLLA